MARAIGAEAGVDGRIMTRELRWQGMVFVAVAMLVAVSTFIVPHLDEQTSLMIIAGLIIVLGVPHGALDTVFATKMYGVNSLRRWALFGLAYGFLSALVVSVWIFAPAAFLAGFLLLSMVHFSGDPGPGSLTTSRILYGGAMIVLPALRYEDEVSRLFGLLAGSEAAVLLTPLLAVAAWPWLAALLVSSVLEFRRDRLTAFELLGVGLLSSLAPPLVGFAVFFCAMHSARHILRTINLARPWPPLLLIGAGTIPMMLIFVIAMIAWITREGFSFETRVVQITFVGLAALTVPHMVLIERFRLSDWGAATDASTVSDAAS